MYLVLILAGVTLFVGGIIAFARWSERRRTVQLQAMAEQLGLNFQATGDASLQKRLARFRLFRQGRSRKLKNLVVGDTGQINISIFDYQFSVGGGNHQSTVSQTVALLESPDLQLPAFALRPENMLDKLGGAIGLHRDINLEDHPRFSRTFLLICDDESAVREVFHKQLVEKLENRKGISMEAVPGLVIIYNSRHRKKAEHLKSFFAESLELYHLLIPKNR